MDRSTAAVLILVVILQGVGTDLFYNQAMDTCSVYQTAKIVRAKQLVVLSTRSFMVDINGFQEDLQSAASMAAAATTKLHKKTIRLAGIINILSTNRRSGYEIGK